MADALSHRPQNNIFTISANVAFLPSFVEALVEGKIFPNYGENGGLQKALSETIIYVPTRRAERALRLCLTKYSQNGASFLPDIRAIGDSDDDSEFYPNFDADSVIDSPRLNDILRLTSFAKLIQPWRENLPQYLKALYGSENNADFWQKASVADALWLAQDLVKLIDEVETEGGDWSKLPEIAKDDVAEWWQITLEFLKIIDEYCPELLQDQTPISQAAWRNQALKKRAHFLNKTRPKKPIIVLGSNGSIPAVAHLMQVISTLPNGAIIIPNLDLTMDKQQWQDLDKAENDISLYGHPQYCLKKLLKTLNIDREQVRELAPKTSIKPELAKIISETMRVANTTDHWVNLDRTKFSSYCDNFTLIEAANEREEALSIAMALRYAIEDKNNKAALVTNNRYLARRVVAELQRFGIKANDSGGIPLAQTPAAQLLRLMIAYIFNPNDVVALLSLLKHPLAKFSHKKYFGKTTIEQFECYILRGAVGRITLDTIDAFIKKRLADFVDDEKLSHLNKPEIIQNIEALWDSFLQAILPLKTMILTEKSSNLSALTATTMQVFENIIDQNNQLFTEFTNDESILALLEFLHDLLNHGDDFAFAVAEWPQIMQALMNTRSVSPSVGGHPRLFIWGTLESRLQNVDTVIIGDLNEGSLPPKQRNDPFLSRPMKTTLQLAPPEKRIGLAAHDFQSLMYMKKVVLSRAVRVDNAPSVPSRWLQRFETVIGQNESKKLRERGDVFISFAKTLERAKNLDLIVKPYPIPPVEARPKHFSVTEIEVLRRDPYAIYAKKILKLQPLDALIRDPNIAERGTLYHAILADMVVENINMHERFSEAKLLELAKKHFEMSALPLDIEALWWPRFTLLIPKIIAYEKSLSKRKSYVEISAAKSAIAKTGVYLSGRADRIDVFGEMAEIIDYKTGSTPTKKQAASLISPQLALEAALLHRNAFSEILNCKAVALNYIRLKDKGEFVEDNICETAKKTAYELGEEAWSRLVELIEYYQKPDIGYLSRAMPPIVNYEGDYDHLARVLEWSAIDDATNIAEGEA